MKFPLPPEISFSKEVLPEGYQAYVFRHESIGELGRLVITPHGDQCQFNCEVVGDADDPMTEKRRAIIEPILKGLCSKVSEITGDSDDPVQKYNVAPQRNRIESQVFPCKKCGKPTGMMIIAPQAITAGELEDFARIMYPEVKKMNVPTWVVGHGIEVNIKGISLGQYLALKIWPKREAARIMLSNEFDSIIDALILDHC